MRVAIVGPLPPPSGGMANQTQQVARLLQEEGCVVEVVQSNAACRPTWIERVRVLRAIFRFIPYVACIWRATARADLLHVMANSGWAWHLCAAPAIWISKVRCVPVLVHYHGGNAEHFFAGASALTLWTLRRADILVVPSDYLQHVFARLGMAAKVLPNLVDLERFGAAEASWASRRDAPNLVVTRNLEAIYDIGTAVRALAVVLKTWPRARLTIAGGGPEQGRLAALADALGVSAHVKFTGPLDAAGIARLYRKADVLLNPSLVDNAPVSVLEAWASGVPVISTDVGGVSFLIEDGRTGILVPPRAPDTMARAVLDLLSDAGKAQRLASAGREAAQRHGWPRVRGCLLDLYSALIHRRRESGAIEAK